MSSIIGYKWIQDNWESSRGNETPWKMGVWKEIDGEIKLCSHGYHACRSIYQSLGYIYGNRLVMIEAEGIQEETDKFVAQRMRVVSEIPSNEIMIEFAIACTKNVLYLYEKQYPDDDRPRKAIDAADAARAAANTAACAAAAADANTAVYAARAARAAVRDAARAARAAAAADANTAVYAAYAAARAAANTAACAAAAADANTAVYAAYAAANTAACATDCAAANTAACAAAAAACAAAAAAAADANTAVYAARAARAAVRDAARAARAAVRNHEIEWQKRKLEQISNKYMFQSSFYEDAL